MKKQRPTPLADALAEMAQTDSTLESRADAVLQIVKSAGIRDSAAFNKAVKAAYTANGWHTQAGRPSRGNRGQPVPVTVKQYVSMVRGAFRAGLVVAHFKTFHALRKSLKAARLAAKPRQVKMAPALAGLRLVGRGDTLTGAPFHDLTVLYEKANRAQRAKIAAEVNRLIQEFRPSVAPVLTLQKAA